MRARPFPKPWSLVLWAAWLGACGGQDDGPAAVLPEVELGAVAGRAIPVLLISLDTLRADRATPWGGAERNSPYLQRLAGESVVFDDVLTQSPNTGPSHRSLFTGQFPHRHGHRYREQLRTPYTMASLLRGSGYRTGAFTGGGWLAPAIGFDQGFAVFENRNERRSTGPRRGLRGVLPQARKWLDGLAGDRPWFLFVHTYDLHCPYWPTPEFRMEFGGDYEPPVDLRTLCGEESFMDLFQPPLADDAALLPYVSRLYDGGVAMTDGFLESFLEDLRADGTLDRIVLVIASDHGESLGEHRMVGHNSMWEEQLRVPLLIRFPDAAHGGTRVAAPAMLVDVLPTLLDYLELPVPPGVQGESLMPSVLAARTTGDRLRVSEYGDLESFRFDGRWKVVIEAGDGAPRYRLYDLQDDPGELRDLAADSAHAPRLRELLDRYHAYRSSTRDEDARFRGTALAAEIAPELSAELSALGYTGVEEER
ncbi:MAG TPA: sulfatase [Planctomycetota bacterium]